jgi:hypothetical protein
MARLKVLSASLAVMSVVFGVSGVGLADEPPGPPDKVTICHKPGTPDEATLTLPVNAAEVHLQHGDTEGPCPAPVPSSCPSLTIATFPGAGFSLPWFQFDAGDVFYVTVGYPVQFEEPTTIYLLIWRETPADQTLIYADFPNTLSYTFPATGRYFVQVGVIPGTNVTFTRWCVPVAG